MRCYVAIICLCFAAAIAGQTALTANEIVARGEDAMRVKGVQGVSTMRIIDEKGGERVRKIKQASKLFDNGETEILVGSVRDNSQVQKTCTKSVKRVQEQRNQDGPPRWNHPDFLSESW